MKETKNILNDVRESVSQILGDAYMVEYSSQNGYNHEKQYIVVRKHGEGASPAFDIAPFIRDGWTVPEIAGFICKTVRDMPTQHAPSIDREYILGHVIPQIVGREGNSRYLEDKVSVPFLDMEVIFRVLVSMGDTDGSIVITQDMAGTFMLGQNELFAAAKENIHATISDLRGIVEEISGGTGLTDTSPIPLTLVISNDNHPYGASAILDREVIHKASRMLGGDMLILPSSIHELIAFPCVPGTCYADFKGMVAEVNDKVVRPEERLTGSVYLYDSKADEIRVVA